MRQVKLAEDGSEDDFFGPFGHILDAKSSVLTY